MAIGIPSSYNDSSSNDEHQLTVSQFVNVLSILGDRIVYSNSTRRRTKMIEDELIYFAVLRSTDAASYTDPFEFLCAGSSRQDCAAVAAVLYVPWTTLHCDKEVVIHHQIVRDIVGQQFRFDPDDGRWVAERIGDNA